MSNITWSSDGTFLINGIKNNQNNEIDENKKMVEKVQSKYKDWLKGENYYFSRILCPLNKRYKVDNIPDIDNDITINSVILEKYFDLLTALEWSEDRITELLYNNNLNLLNKD